MTPYPYEGLGVGEYTLFSSPSVTKFVGVGGLRYSVHYVNAKKINTHLSLLITAFHNKTIGMTFISTATASLDPQKLQRGDNTSCSAWWHALEEFDTDGIDDDSFQNVTDVHGEIDRPWLRSPRQSWRGMPQENSYFDTLIWSCNSLSFMLNVNHRLFSVASWYLWLSICVIKIMCI